MCVLNSFPMSVLLSDGLTLWTKFWEARKPERGPTGLITVLVSVEMIQAGTWDLLAMGNGLHLREQGAKSKKSQSSYCCAFDPRRSWPYWYQLSWWASPAEGIFSSAPFVFSWTWTTLWTQWSVLYLNSGILAWLPVAVDLLGKSLMHSSHQQPDNSIVEGAFTGWWCWHV